MRVTTHCREASIQAFHSAPSVFNRLASIINGLSQGKVHVASRRAHTAVLGVIAGTGSNEDTIAPSMQRRIHSGRTRTVRMTRRCHRPGYACTSHPIGWPEGRNRAASVVMPAWAAPSRQSLPASGAHPSRSVTLSSAIDGGWTTAWCSRLLTERSLMQRQARPLIAILGCATAVYLRSS